MFTRSPTLINQDLSTVELNNLAKYTSVGYDISPEAIAAKRRFNPLLLAKGCWRSFFAPNWDPANHVASHLALNASTFLFGFSRVAYRLPNYLAGLITAWLLFFLLYRLSGSPVYAVFGSLVFCLSPYVLDKTVVIRGYAINLLLCMIHLLLLRALVSRRAPLWIHLLFGMVAGIMSINLISSPFFWNAAVYGIYGVALLLHLFGPAQQALRPPHVGVDGLVKEFAKSAECRRLASGLFIYFTIFGGFCLRHFHKILAAKEKYQASVEGIHDFLSGLFGTTEISLCYDLFPGIWLGLLIGGLLCAGLVLSAGIKQWVAYAALPLAYIFCLLTYVLLTRSSIYARVHGGLLPSSLAALGVAWRFSRESVSENGLVSAFAKLVRPCLVAGLAILIGHGVCYAAMKKPLRGWETLAGVVDARIAECERAGEVVSAISTYSYDEWFYPLLSSRKAVADFNGVPGRSLTVIFCSSHEEIPVEWPPHLRSFYATWDHRTDIWEMPTAWASKCLSKVRYYAAYEHRFDVAMWMSETSEKVLSGIVCVRHPALSISERDALLADGLLRPEFSSIRVLVAHGRNTLYIPFDGIDQKRDVARFVQSIFQDQGSENYVLF